MNLPRTNRAVGIGIVTYNNLPLIQQCFPSWRSARDCHLVVFDNGSEPEIVEWLKRRPIDRLILARENKGLCYARNRIIEYYRERDFADFVLLADSDVRFHDEMIEEMLNRIQTDERIGIVGYPQANKRFPTAPDGSVEEIANECQLTRLRMWLEIGLFPEILHYYSGDSWKSTIANMHGWRTVVIEGSQGYDHFQHGSHVNPGVKEAMTRDTTLWARKEAEFIKYWRTRILLGKGGQYQDATKDADTDAKIEETTCEPPFDGVELLMPRDGGFQFTPQRDVETLVWLSRQVPGNILEVGCHRGITAMQMAFNNPQKLVYAIDYSGGEPTMCADQLNEQPRSGELGRYLKPFRNVCVFDERFDRFRMDSLDSVDFVFYDADLTYDTAKASTEKILEHFFRNSQAHSRLLVWHDYVPKWQKSNHPAWLRIGEYVRREVSHRFPVRYFHGTNLACLAYPPLEKYLK